MANWNQPGMRPPAGGNMRPQQPQMRPPQQMGQMRPPANNWMQQGGQMQGGIGPSQGMMGKMMPPPGMMRPRPPQMRPPMGGQDYRQQMNMQRPQMNDAFQAARNAMTQLGRSPSPTPMPMQPPDPRQVAMQQAAMQQRQQMAGQMGRYPY
jgi:hypothetical protein